MAKELSLENIFVLQMNLPAKEADQRHGADGSVLTGTSFCCMGLRLPLLHLRHRNKPLHEVCRWAKLL